MPYKVVKNHPECKIGYALVKEDDGKVMGCHRTEESALRQMRAIYASEKKQFIQYLYKYNKRRTMVKIINNKFYFQNDEGDLIGPFDTRAEALNANN